MVVRYFFLMVMLAVSIPCAAVQVCDQKQTETTPLSRFIDNADGTITDKKTKHTWLRCAVGMTWNGKSCAGKSLEYLYREAFEVVDEMNAQNMAKRDDWRLPTEQELSSIVEKRCFSPAINTEVFPYSPQSGFWTSTDNPGINTSRVMLIHFLNGNAYIANKNQTWRIRLIADK